MVKNLHVNSSKRTRRKRFLCLRNASSMQGGAFKYKEKKKPWSMTLLQWSKVVYVEGNPSLKAPWGWTTFTNLIQEVGSHSQLSSKRLDHIHQISSKRLDHINKSHSRIFIHVWSWNYDYLDKDDTTILALFFLTNVDMKLFNIFFFLTYAYMKLSFLTVEILQKWGVVVGFLCIS